MATTSHAGLNYGVNPSSHGWYFHTGAHVPEVSPTVNGYGDLIVTKWSEPAADPSLPRRHGLTVTHGTYPDGRQPSGPTVDVSTGPYTDFGAPAVGLAPGGSVLDRSDEYLALPVRLPAAAGGAGLYIDHADGRGLVRVASLGAVCPAPQVAFSPSHRSVAYLEAAGPAGAGCFRTRLWVMDADGARYGSRPARLVADSGAGGPFTSMSWRARTPAPFAGRIGGIDRVATGIASSRVLFTEGAARTAVIAGSQAFPDALAATPLAGRLGGPLLMTRASGLESRVAAELVRAVQPGATVHLVGGPAVLGSAVEKAVAAKGFRVVRLAGINQFETARGDRPSPRRQRPPSRDVAQQPGPHGRRHGFRRRAGRGPRGQPLVRHRRAEQRVTTAAVTRAYLQGAMQQEPPYDRWLNAVGGAAVKAVESDALTRGKVNWVAGADRYQTASTSRARSSSRRRWPAWLTVATRGTTVTGGTAIAHLGMPLMLVNGSTAPTPPQSWWRLTRSATDAVVAFGSAAVVPDAPVNRAQELGGRQTALWGPDLL